MFNVLHKASRVFLSRPNSNKSYGDIASGFEESAVTLLQRINKAEDGKRNHSSLTHLIGIERWAQQRVRVGLGQPFVTEEYDGYRPAKDTPWSELRDQFAQTRKETVSLVHELNANTVSPSIDVFHNQFGPLPLHAWLHYIKMHADFEAKKIR